METLLRHLNGLTSATPIRLYAAFLNSTFSSTGRPAVTFTDDEELAKLPMYYVMDPDKTMPETMAPYMPSPAEVAGCRWLTENDLYVDVTE